MNKSILGFRNLQKVGAIVNTFALLAIIVAPLMVALPTASAADTIIFTENFDQSGNSLTNGWQPVFSGDDPGSDARDDSTDDGWGGVEVSGKAMLLEGTGPSHTNDPDEAAERGISTRGYSTIKVQYSRATNGFNPGDELVVRYSLDDGSFVTLETVTGNQAHSLSPVFTISNSSRNTKLTLRFYVNGTATDDEAGIDDLTVWGDNAPLFYDGFESNNFTSGSWVTEESPLISTSEYWTDNAGTPGHSAHLDGSSNSNPDDAIVKSFSTVGYENIRVRFARTIDNLSSGESFKARYSTDGSTWTDIESTDNQSFGSLTSGVLPSAADNNPNFKLRFEINAGGSNDDAYVDDVVIWADTIAVVVASTTTGVSCGNVNLGATSTCVVTVTNTTGTSTPSGSVNFTSNATGTFSASSCALAGTTTTSSCSVTYTPTVLNGGSHQVTATYPGNANFASSTGNQTITVTDVTAPTFGVTADVTAEATASSGTPVSFSVAATDDGDATSSISISCNPPSGSSFAMGTTTVICTATDTSGNSASTTFVVTVQDTTPPVLILNGNSTVNLVIGVDDYIELGATASDNIDGDITVNIVTGGSVNTSTPGTYPITYDVSDAAGNSATQTIRTVFVSDSSSPAIVPISDITLEATGPGGATTTYGPVTATDDVDGTITADCTPTSSSLFALGTTTVSCSATDSSSNTGMGVGLYIRVVDTTPPMLTLNGSPSTTFQIGDTYTELGAIFSDIVDSTGTVTIGGDLVPAGPFITSGVYNITYNATDTAGNPATTLFRTVTVTNAATTTLTVTIGAGAPSGAGAVVTVGSVSSTYSGPVLLNDTETFNATATPVIGYGIVSAGTCYGTATLGGPYVCVFDYASSSFDITASAGSNGSISPAGVTSVPQGGSQAYTITPNSGFQISDVLVDGVSVGGVSTYTFSSVVASHTIAASFSAIPPSPPSGGGGGGGGGSITLVAASNPTSGGGGGSTGGGSTTSTPNDNQNTGGGTTGSGSATGTAPTGGNETGGGNTGGGGGGLALGGGNTGGGTTGGGTITTGGGATTTGGTLAQGTTTESTSTTEATSTESTSLLASILDALGGNMNLWWLLLIILAIIGLIYYYSRD